jgi:hypothetical protein
MRYQIRFVDSLLLGKALEEAIPDLIHGDAQNGQFQNITGADP